MADEERPTSEEEQSLRLPSLRASLRRRKAPRTTPHRTEPMQPPEPVGPVLTEAPPVARRRRRLGVHLPGPAAALVSGALVGAALVAMTTGTLHLCTAMRGTSSCGEAGLVPLLAIVVVAVVLGSVLLRVLGVEAHTSTSLLAVSLLVVVVLLALLPALDQRWALVGVPLLATLTYLASWWLTTSQRD